MVSKLSNEFLFLTYNLYEEVYDIEENLNYSSTVKESIPRSEYDNFFSYLWAKITGKNKRDKKIYPRVEEAKNAIDQFLYTLSRPYKTLTFFNIWDFCEFVRIAEKIFFYDNDPTNDIFVEMKFGSNENTRKLRITKPNAEIRLTLEKNLYSNDILTINVVRNFGLKMENTYTIVNEDIVNVDKSDEFLIKEVNEELKKYMIDIFSEVVNQIMSRLEK